MRRREMEGLNFFNVKIIHTVAVARLFSFALLINN